MPPTWLAGLFEPSSIAQWGLNALILICLGCWGIWGIFDKKALQVASNRDVLFAMLICQLPQLPLCLWMLNCFHPGWQVSGPLIYFSALGATLYLLSMFCYVTAMSRAEAGYVLGFTAGYPLVAQILAVFLLGEKLVPGLMLGGLLIAAGVFSVGLTGDKKEQSNDKTADNRNIELTHRSIEARLRDDQKPSTNPSNNSSIALLEAPAQTSTLSVHKIVPSKESIFSRMVVPACVIVATLTWGIKGLFDKIAVGMAPPLVVYTVQLVCNLTALIPFCVYFYIAKQKPQMHDRQMWIFTGLSTVTLAIGGWSYLAALCMASASYVITITGCYPLLMYGFTLLFLKEKFNVTRLFGIALIVFGGICVQLTQH